MLPNFVFWHTQGSNKAREQCRYRQIANVARVLDPLADVLHPIAPVFAGAIFVTIVMLACIKRLVWMILYDIGLETPGSLSPLGREAGWHRQSLIGCQSAIEPVLHPARLEPATL
jgi:hypothetical protein